MTKWILMVLAWFALIAVLLYMKSYQSFSDRMQANEEKIYKTKKGNQRALVIFQDSKHGTVSKYADTVREQLLGKGYNVTVNHPRNDLNYDPMKYDLVVLLGPVYLGKPSKTFTDYISKNPFINRKIVIILVGYNPEDTRELKILEERLPNHNTVYTLKIGKEDTEQIGKIIKKATG